MKSLKPHVRCWYCRYQILQTMKTAVRIFFYIEIRWRHYHKFTSVTPVQNMDVSSMKKNYYFFKSVVQPPKEIFDMYHGSTFMINGCYQASLSMIQMIWKIQICLCMFEQLFPWEIYNHWWFSMNCYDGWSWVVLRLNFFPVAE